MVDTGTSGITSALQMSFPEVDKTGNLYYHLIFWPSNLRIDRGPFESLEELRYYRIQDREIFLK